MGNVVQKVLFPAPPRNYSVQGLIDDGFTTYRIPVPVVGRARDAEPIRVLGVLGTPPNVVNTNDSSVRGFLIYAHGNGENLYTIARSLRKLAAMHNCAVFAWENVGYGPLNGRAKKNFEFGIELVLV